jgi:hypothetical protein
MLHQKILEFNRIQGFLFEVHVEQLNKQLSGKIRYFCYLSIVFSLLHESLSINL